MKLKLIAALLFVAALGGCAIVPIVPPVYVGVHGGYYYDHGGYYGGHGGWRY